MKTFSSEKFVVLYVEWITNINPCWCRQVGEEFVCEQRDKNHKHKQGHDVRHFIRWTTKEDMMLGTFFSEPSRRTR